MYEIAALAAVVVVLVFLVAVCVGWGMGAHAREKGVKGVLERRWWGFGIKGWGEGWR